MSFPFWNIGLEYVSRCLDAERIEDAERPVAGEWWDNAKYGYKSALYFCPVFEDYLTGRHGDLNARATALSKRTDPETKRPLLHPELIPKIQTAKTAIDGVNPVSFQYLVKMFMSVEAIAKHDDDPEAQEAYAPVRDLISRPCVVPSFHTLNWEKFSSTLQSAELAGKSLEAVSEIVLGHENRLNGASPAAVLPLIKSGKDGNGKNPYTVTQSLAESVVNGVNERLQTMKKEPVTAGDIFVFSLGTSSRALPVKQGNLVILR